MTWEKLQLEIYLVPGADVYGNRPSQHEIKMSEIFSAFILISINAEFAEHFNIAYHREQKYTSKKKIN